MPTTTRRERTVNTVVTDVDLKIVDEAFADLETTTLRRDNPAAAAAASAMPVEQSLPTYHGAVQQLASQLRILDEQRQRLAQLLHDLQTSPTTETWRLSARPAWDMLGPIESNFERSLPRAPLVKSDSGN